MSMRARCRYPNGTSSSWRRGVESNLRRFGGVSKARSAEPEPPAEILSEAKDLVDVQSLAHAEIKIARISLLARIVLDTSVVEWHNFLAPVCPRFLISAWASWQRSQLAPFRTDSRARRGRGQRGDEQVQVCFAVADRKDHAITALHFLFDLPAFLTSTPVNLKYGGHKSEENNN